MLIKGILLFVICTLSFSCKEKQMTENDRTDIKKLIDSYDKAYINRDWVYITKLIHPGVFDFFSKTDFINALDSSLNRKNYRIVFHEFTIDSLSKLVHNNFNKYVLAYFRNRSVMEFSKELDSIHRIGLAMNMCEQMKESFDKDYISCKAYRDSVEYIVLEKCYMIFLENKNRWFLLNETKEGKKLVDEIIPEKVRKELND